MIYDPNIGVITVIHSKAKLILNFNLLLFVHKIGNKS